MNKSHCKNENVDSCFLFRETAYAINLMTERIKMLKLKIFNLHHKCGNLGLLLFVEQAARTERVITGETKKEESTIVVNRTMESLIIILYFCNKERNSFFIVIFRDIVGTL